jgi:hypothetical protein
MSEDKRWRRRKPRRQEWAEHVKLVELLTRYLDPATVFWTSLENRPSSLLNGLLQKKRGVRSGLPDVMVIACHRLVVFVELKSVSGIASKAQKQIRSELLAVGCNWWMARSARAALTALHRAGVPFRRPWKPPVLQPWEGPFTGDEARLPQHPSVLVYRREYNRHWREGRRAQGLPPPTEELRARRREYVRRWRERARQARISAAAAERGDGAQLAASEPASA